MKIISEIEKMREFSRQIHKAGKTIGFVPTMGYLHEGHLSLARAAKKECDLVVVSIYVNPSQFGANEDLENYPKDMDRDVILAEKEGVDVIFAPSSDVMYPSGYATAVEVGGRITSVLCGASRPGHFKGVTTIVSKLFNIVDPDKAYFGQKDAQQSVVISRMAKDLDMSVEIRVMPIVREEDGLAMSSRNAYLSDDERQQALGLFKAIKKAEESVASDITVSSQIIQQMEKVLLEGPDVTIDYVSIVDADTLEDADEIQGKILVAIAVFVGKTRLIDNVIINRVQGSGSRA